MDIGIEQAATRPILNPLPLSWLGLAVAPPLPPDWASIGALTSIQIRNLLAQIAYDLSEWDYKKIGTENQLGRYQFSSAALEEYGILAAGSTDAYPDGEAVNYRQCWTPVTIRKNTNSYANYNYNLTTLSEFLNSTTAQEHLAYQLVYDFYNSLNDNGGILATDTTDVIAGMIYVAWTLDAENNIIRPNSDTSRAYTWRYSGLGNGVDSFNSGRYAITILSQ
jgi:hypothetical protein